MAIESECRAVCFRVVQLLKEERERIGLSKYALAAKSGLSQQAIGYIESGTTMPAFDTVLQISRGLDVDLADLLKSVQSSKTLPK